MGQYYNILIQTKQGKFKLYDRSVNNEYMMAKLTEHSWIGNSFMDSFCNQLINKPQRVAWVGDYSDEISNYNIPNDLEDNTIKSLHKMAWNDLPVNTINRQEIDYSKYYLVNHTKNIFLDFSTFINDNTYIDNYSWNWCLHPLSLLTALGNGLGGGDYHGTSMELIGSWCWDYISLEEKETFDNTGFIKIKYEFKENY